MAHILIIDDDVLIRKLVAAALESMGHSFQESSDGTEGLAAAKATPFDLIISDMNMPNMTGWDLMREMKSDPQTKDIPIMVLSAQHTSEDYDEAYSAGATAFIKKPVDLQALAAKIEEVLAA
ncbi:MAG: response regulator [Rhodospirillales bacterium]|jgi:CheY-like chemotaxis protein|nr:response regulator [Rhodospirillales bacterium]